MWDWFDELFDDALDWLDEHGFDVHEYFSDDDDGHWTWIGDLDADESLEWFEEE